MKHRTLELIVGACACALVAGVVHAAGWGRLMAVAPWAPGFERLEGARSVVLFRPELRADALEVSQIADRLVERTENYHRLPFPQRPEIVLTGSEKEYRRLSGGEARFRVIPVRGRLFVAPRALAEARRQEIHLDVYLQHELSHSLLDLHAGWQGALGLPPWFEEGLATLSAAQLGVDGYFDRKQVLDWWKAGRATPPSAYESRWKDSALIEALPRNERWRFLYSQYAVLIEDLQISCGRDRFQNLLERLLRGEAMTDAFPAVYGTSAENYFNGLVARSI